MATHLPEKVLRNVVRAGKGLFGYRRTPQFLSLGKLYFKKSVKAVSISYRGTKSGAGLRYFVGENIPQIQFKNPNIQILVLKNHGEYPHVKVYYEGGKKAIIDCTDKDNETILKELTAISGKLETQVKREEDTHKRNPADFGDPWKGMHHCICTMPGQVPCTAVKPRKVVHAWKEKKNNSS